jgi:hypothetical protein
VAQQVQLGQKHVTDTGLRSGGLINVNTRLKNIADYTTTSVVVYTYTSTN